MLNDKKIMENWTVFLDNIAKNLSKKRADRLLLFYNQYDDRIITMPWATNNSYSGAYPGGYVHKVNRILDVAFKLNEVFSSSGCEINHTKEELAFVAINFSLGKFGDENDPLYLDNDNEWKVKNLGEFYKFNPNLPYMKVSDRSIFLLNSIGIRMSYNEFLGVKLSSEIYEDSNKVYNYSVNNKNNLIPHIIYQASLATLN